MIALSKEENVSYLKQKVCYICKKHFINDDDNTKYHKVRDHCHLTEKYGRTAHIICNLKYEISKKLLQYFITVLHMTIIL